ncbi:helix-loop-helix protein delilah [Bradysia coprophila]|uniref:helix-loop-helix protein delilah n=1 Tax=Bradysia coprophila TaxID=38358 RepID=UPI00187DAC04|nr:helix-loop-helix protein delilah [Bradysia coprophila]
MHHRNQLEMESITFDEMPMHESDESCSKKGEKYSLRQRQRRQSSRNKTKSDQSSVVPSQPNEPRKPKQKPKPKAAPLSKYRRKTANARERTRMREINSAFENLRKCVPLSISSGTPTSTNEKLTKITTLRLAMKYIRTLNEVLTKPNSDQNFHISHSINNNNNSSSNNNNYFSSNNNTTASTNSKDLLSEMLYQAAHIPKRATYKCQTKDRSKYYNQKLEISPCLTPPMDSPIDMGLMLESDGESLHLSEPCLSPLSQNMKPFSCATGGAMELGLFLESDTDSLQLSEPCLSPLGGLDSLNPFGDLLHTGFSEHSSLDIYLS